MYKDISKATLSVRSISEVETNLFADTLTSYQLKSHLDSDVCIFANVLRFIVPSVDRIERQTVFLYDAKLILYLACPKSTEFTKIRHPATD